MNKFSRTIKFFSARAGSVRLAVAGALIAGFMAVAATPAFSQPVWWDPWEPQPGDLIRIIYDTDSGTIPYPATSVRLHWGINGWNEPPESMWPPDTEVAVSGAAVQTPMTSAAPGLDSMWVIEIQTDMTVTQLDFVFTDGTNWDNNNGNDWHVQVGGEPPPPPPPPPPPQEMSWHRFIYDTRSANAGYGVDDITTLYVRGVFNEWTTANPMAGPDTRGVYSAEVLVPVGPNPYKFFFNRMGTDIWMQDPDNPLTDGSEYSNSQVIVEPDTLPYFFDVNPAEGVIYTPGSTVDFSARVRTADDSVALVESPVTVTLDGVNLSGIVWDSANMLASGSATLVSEGIHELSFLVLDVDERVGTCTRTIGVIAADGGFFAVDALDDDDGPGTYTYPSGSVGKADLRSLKITEAGGGDSLLIEVEFVEPVTAPGDGGPNVLIQISTDVNGPLVSSPMFETEVATPDWNGNGAQVCLSPYTTAEGRESICYRLITGRDPLAFGALVTKISDFSFMVALADLEEALGSFNTGWYFAAYSYFNGVSEWSGVSYEVGEADGGIGEAYDPDAYDMLFVDSPELQRMLLGSYTSTRMAALDNVGRGFALVEPAEIGPNVNSGGPVLRFISRNVTTVSSQKTIWCKTSDINALVTIHHLFEGGDRTYSTAGSNDFGRDVTLEPGANTFRLESTDDTGTSRSPVLTITLKVPVAPEAVFANSYASGTVTLDASGSSDPQEQAIDYAWTPDPDNPATVSLSGANTATAAFPKPSVNGEYYFDLTLGDPDGNTTPARTFVTVFDDSVHIFSFDETAAWVRDAIVYEIFPRSYAADRQLSSITADLDRIAGLGVNTIWLMPIFTGPSTHGYAITDYYGIEEDYGTMADFDELVSQAHARGLRIVLDLVINHTAIEHPFMQEAIELGDKSHYYDYYDRDLSGNHTYYYDWQSLPNLNYDNPDVSDYFLEMSKWWVSAHDVDGFRCDVAWGVLERNPEFWVEWRRQLKTIKPELFLLAEASATDFALFEDRFDLAYDWELYHGDRNSFYNLFANTTVTGLHNRITNLGVPFPDYRYPFRFMENHDEARYISRLSGQQTRLAATLLLTIPGVPLIYAGQEVGEASTRELINWGSDLHDLHGHYRNLIEARNLFPALRNTEQRRLGEDISGEVYVYSRYSSGENPVVVVLNLEAQPREVSVQLPLEDWGIDPGGSYYLNDLLNLTHRQASGSELSEINADLPAYGSSVFVIADSAVVLSSPERRELPGSWALEQNYPNPFNPVTIIRFSLPRAEHVRLTVYNLLGRRVRSLVARRMIAGAHAVSWDGRGDSGEALASGIYFYRIVAGPFMDSRKMLLIK